MTGCDGGVVGRLSRVSWGRRKYTVGMRPLGGEGGRTESVDLQADRIGGQEDRRTERGL